MNILITESQYNKLTEEKYKEFLYKFWDLQKKNGEEPHLDDMLFNVLNIRKDMGDDYKIIRPLWYEYNGGYQNLLQQVKDEIEHDEIHIVGDRGLDMTIFVDEVHSYNEKEFGGLIDIICHVVGGTIDGYVYNDDTEEFEDEPNMDIFDQYALLDYDTGHFVDFLKEECTKYFEEKLGKYGIPIYVDLMVK